MVTKNGTFFYEPFTPLDCQCKIVIDTKRRQPSALLASLERNNDQGEVKMLVVDGFFENGVFVPEKPLADIKGRQKAVLRIDLEEEPDIQQRIAVAERLVGIASKNAMTLEEIRNKRLARQ